MDSPCDTIPLSKQFGGKVDLLTDHTIQNSKTITQNEKTPDMCKSSSLLPLVITSQNTIIDIPEYLLNGAYLRDTSVEKDSFNQPPHLLSPASFCSSSAPFSSPESLISSQLPIDSKMVKQTN